MFISSFLINQAYADVACGPVKITHLEAGMFVVVIDAGDVGFMLEKGSFNIISKAYSLLVFLHLL